MVYQFRIKSTKRAIIGFRGKVDFDLSPVKIHRDRDVITV